VQIDLVVRAICCLRPGVPGLSDHIRVRSIVGRWLEHSRIYHFGGDGGQYLLGSADMMERNLDRRVEAIVPVSAPEIRERLQEILDLALADDTRAWQLDSDGAWHKLPSINGVNAQQALQDLAIGRSRRRRREVEVLLGHGAPRG
jgi:polyphosphate kinase